jgi:general secretion pathway protein A
MYLDFYKLHLKPFQISTDPRFLWLGEKHQEALAVLKYGILDNKGFLLLTGDVGTGKTTLLNALIDSLGDNVLVAMVPDPGLAKMDFFNFVLDSFGVDNRYRSKGEFLIFLKNYLVELSRQGKQALLIIDECQNLNQKLLEEVRLLSNIEKADSKLINIFFVGQSEFNNIILRPKNRAIRQRITINFNISPLSVSETDAYIRFRLAVAGADETIFTRDAIKEVYKFSNGYPRLINIICDQALLTGFVKEKKKVDEKIVAECADELKIDPGTSIEESDATPEARSEQPEQKDDTPGVKNRVTDRLQHLPLKTPLVLALVVVLIIWAGLVATFILNRQSSDATHNDVEKQSPAGNSSAALVSPQTPTNGPEQPSEAKPTKENGSQGRHASQQDATPALPPTREAGTVTEIAPSVGEQSAVGAPDDEQAHASLASTVREQAAPRISLVDIQNKHGRYPEVFFGNDSNKLDVTAYDMLGLISQFWLQNPETIIILRGYTDQTGSRNYNLKLSEFRADMIKTYLVGKGVRDESITAIGIGPDEAGPGGTKVPYDGERRKVLIEIISPDG